MALQIKISKSYFLLYIVKVLNKEGDARSEAGMTSLGLK
jgi:hypothetical protein